MSKGKNLFETASISDNFGINKADLIKQVRKHLNVVVHANNYENNFLISKDAERFETLNPINVYYQLMQNNDYSFDP